MERDRLEKRLCCLMSLKHFVLTGYARNGLYLLIKALGWDHNTEIITPAFTCSIIPKTIEKAGVRPIPIDSEEAGLNIDPQKLEKAITMNTKAIYVIHTYGTAARIDEICAIANEHNLIVIEDLAHSLFSYYKGKQLGTYGDFALLSFTKKIINFEGGAIGTNNTTIYENMLSIQNSYTKYRFFTFNDIVNNITRIIGSIWESKFYSIALVLMKMMDISDKVFYNGQYGLDVDSRKFFMHEIAKRITLMQLDSLFIRNKDRKKNSDYVDFIRKFSKVMKFPDLNQNSNDTLPLYNVGIIKKNPLNSFFSFRTWFNNYEFGRYPRADYLYSNLRIFANMFYYIKRG
ncbi:MAG: aminotransferase class I/II-fold pyridoxal phosphate-dependent enzyme [Spirochaetota bacterium]|nr:aminotransferase class I/II-fold pyridoxal phosphate-dependent enzyme [Spirochaetota bacterium]